METTGARSRLLLFALTVGLIVPAFAADGAAQFGSLSGNVTDPHGNPLVGVTVSLIGPMLPGSQAVDTVVEHVITDAHGKFKVEHLVPGWYSVKVSSAARLPSFRNGVKVEAGLATRQNFTLSDIFSPVRFEIPQSDTSFWGEDWKWVLRTSASTRPVLRYQQPRRDSGEKKDSNDQKKPLPPSQRLIGMTPGSASRLPLSGDPGLGSVLAYLRPLSENSDVLVAGSMTANGGLGSSLATAFRRNLTRDDPQEISIAVHQLSFGEALPLPANGANLNDAQGVVVGYANARRLSDSVTLTTGFEIDYLNAPGDAMVAQPRVKLEDQITPSTAVAARYGVGAADGGSTLLERVGELSSFPVVTMRGYRPRLESLNHAEVSLDHRLSESSHLELAAYRDDFADAAVWGRGGPDQLAWLSGSVMPNPAANGLTLNAGKYSSSGVRAAYAVRLGSNVEAAFLYAVGDALAAKSTDPLGAPPSSLRAALRTRRTDSVGGKVSARIPMSKTEVTTSYQWLPQGRITGIDPYGQASLAIHPYLDVQIRQPLPYIAFIPAHIEAMADFRNLLEQGYVPICRNGDDPLLLSAAYRSFRGGFSVQF